MTGSPPSEVYLHGHHDSVLRSHRWRTAENSAGYLLALLPADARVLDVGCRPGTITADLAARVPDGQVTGRLARAWLRWAGSEDAWFLIPHGEIVGRA
jgi:SAM-dependent methyltransferase